MKNTIIILPILSVLLAGSVLLSCRRQSCDYDYMSHCKLVYLKEPYKTTCLYCDGKQYKVVAHLFVEPLNNYKFEVVGKLPKDYQVYDTLDVLASYSKIPHFDLWVDPLPNPNHLPIEFVKIDCIEKK